MNAEEAKHCKDFGLTLKQMRLEAGYSQGDISKACGFMSPQLISNVERGVCWAPMNVLAQMSDLYGVKKSVMLEHLMEYRKKVWASQLGVRVKSK